MNLTIKLKCVHNWTSFCAFLNSLFVEKVDWVDAAGETIRGIGWLSSLDSSSSVLSAGCLGGMGSFGSTGLVTIGVFEPDIWGVGISPSIALALLNFPWNRTIKTALSVNRIGHSSRDEPDSISTWNKMAKLSSSTHPVFAQVPRVAPWDFCPPFHRLSVRWNVNFRSMHTFVLNTHSSCVNLTIQGTTQILDEKYGRTSASYSNGRLASVAKWIIPYRLPAQKG